MRKPDRFTRRAKKELATPWELNQPRLAMLFRAEHNAVVRLVKQLERSVIGVHTWDKGYLFACNEIIDALQRRAR